MIEYVEAEALPGKDEILARLASSNRDELLAILTSLCPCRNACYDVAVWEAMLGLSETSADRDVREGAHHALLTLRETSRADTRARDLLRRLAERPARARRWSGPRVYPQWFRRQLKRVGRPEDVRYPKVSRRDLPTLIEELASDDPVEQRDAMRLLCPKDGRRLNRKVWRAILDGRRSADVRVRTKCEIASRRLREHASACPKAHEETTT